jgi:hypothetical protein
MLFARRQLFVSWAHRFPMPCRSLPFAKRWPRRQFSALAPCPWRLRSRLKRSDSDHCSRCAIVVHLSEFSYRAPALGLERISYTRRPPAPNIQTMTIPLRLIKVVILTRPPERGDDEKHPPDHASGNSNEAPQGAMARRILRPGPGVGGSHHTDRNGGRTVPLTSTVPCRTPARPN